jgi:PST family polysaccharide transporter
LLQARQQLAAVAILNAVHGLLSIAATVVAAYAGFGPVGIAAAYAAAAIVSAALMLWFVAREGVLVGITFSWQSARHLLWEGRYYGVQLVVNNGAAQAEHVLVPRLMGTTLFGYFAAGTLLAVRLQALADGLASASYAAMAEAEAREGRASARRVFLRFLLLAMLACVVASAAVSLLVQPIAQLLFPGQAETCARVIEVTIWSLPLAAVARVFGSALNALGRDAVQARISLVAGVCHLLLAAGLIWRFGLEGASWSIVLQEALWAAMLAPSVFALFRARGEAGGQ